MCFNPAHSLRDRLKNIETWNGIFESLKKRYSCFIKRSPPKRGVRFRWLRNLRSLHVSVGYSQIFSFQNPQHSCYRYSHFPREFSLVHPLLTVRRFTQGEKCVTSFMGVGKTVTIFNGVGGWYKFHWGEKAVIRLIIFTNPSTRAGYDTRSIFKRSLTGLNSDFSFSGIVASPRLKNLICPTIYL